MKMRRLYFLFALPALCLCLIPFRAKILQALSPVAQKIRGTRTVEDRIKQYGDAVHPRLGPYFATNNVTYPPDSVILVGLKHEKQLEIWAADKGRPPRFIGIYPVLAASGKLGPKLQEGDLQVPEGIYRVESLNPNSMFHLALRLNFPNEYDLEKAKLENRRQPGTDIMIHGSRFSVGCLAMGDQAAEDLFVLAAETGIENIKVILSPVDFRVRELPPDMPQVPPWTSELYDTIKAELMRLQ